MFAVTVSFQIESGRLEAFLTPMLENASRSKEVEPGCLQFDVCTDASQPDTVFLYEVYSSKEAFELHLASDHFKRFDAAVASMIVRKTVQTYSVVRQ